MAATEVTAKYMNMTEIIKKAKAIGIDPGKMEKVELILAIQTAEGSNPCFGTLEGQCAHAECCFMQDCFKTSLAKYKQAEQYLKQHVGELTSVNEQLQYEITEREHVESGFEQYCKRLEQQIDGQTVELATVNARIQRQTAEYQQLGERLALLQAKMDNINSVINKQLELRETKPGAVESSTFVSAPPGCTYN